VLLCSNNSSNGTMMRVSPAKPSYLEYHIPADVWSVIVRAQSDDDLCGVMSLQELKVTVLNLPSCVHVTDNFFDPGRAVSLLCESVCVSGQHLLNEMTI